MPLLDVSDILFDPDLCEAFTVTRRSQTAVGGKPVFSEAEPIQAVGSIQPARTSTLMRLADGSNFASTIEIYTAFPLTNGGGNGDTVADIVMWQGAPYTVIDVADWTRFGAGFVRAIAQLATTTKPSL